MTAILLTNVERTYRIGEAQVEALRGVSMQLEPGSSTAVVGPSGSGKSTLLHLCGALDRATGGEVRVLDQDLAAADDKTLTRFRQHHIGFVFQFFHLFPTLTAQENVALPARMAKLGSAEANERATVLLEQLGMSARSKHLPDELSGGERQRVAIARALVMRPQILLADEPTGNLDHDTGRRIMDILLELTQGGDRTLLVVTHDDEVARRCDRVITLRDGLISDAGVPA